MKELEEKKWLLFFLLLFSLCLVHEIGFSQTPKKGLFGGGKKNIQSIKPQSTSRNTIAAPSPLVTTVPKPTQQRLEWEDPLDTMEVEELLAAAKRYRSRSIALRKEIKNLKLLIDTLKDEQIKASNEIAALTRTVRERNSDLAAARDTIIAREATISMYKAENEKLLFWLRVIGFLSVLLLIALFSGYFLYEQKMKEVKSSTFDFSKIVQNESKKSTENLRILSNFITSVMSWLSEKSSRTLNRVVYQDGNEYYKNKYPPDFSVWILSSQKKWRYKNKVYDLPPDAIIKPMPRDEIPRDDLDSAGCWIVPLPLLIHLIKNLFAWCTHLRNDCSTVSTLLNLQ